MADRADEIAREITYGRDRKIDNSDDDENLHRLIAAALRSYGIAYADEKLESAAKQMQLVCEIRDEPEMADLATLVRSLKSGGAS